ncbi:MAG: hypothetical protein Q9210_004414 [Variospora velana]
MAKEHFSQHNLAAEPAASAKDSHPPPHGPSDYLHNSTSTRPSRAGHDSTLPDEPLHHRRTSLPSNPSTNSNEPAAIPTASQLAGASERGERVLAHETALRRLNGLEPKPNREGKPAAAASIASTQPVLVREYSQSSPRSSTLKQSRMKQKRFSGGKRESSEMPPLESFSFQDILSSIDPEIHDSIDKIAEICGRSRMSLADEYGSHLPPQGDLSLLTLHSQGDQPASSRLEPVEEASSTHEEAMQDPRSARAWTARLSLVCNSNRAHEDLLSAPVTATATSVVGSQTQSVPVPQESKRPEAEASYIPQLLAWLRSSRDDSSQSARISRRNSGAAHALQRILGSSTESTSN